MHNQSFAQILELGKVLERRECAPLIHLRTRSCLWARAARDVDGAWLDYLDDLLSGHNFHSQAEAAAAAASSQWRRLSKYKPHSYSVYAVTLHIARGSRVRCQVHPASTWGLAPSPAPVTAHSPLINGFYLSIYLVGTGKHQNIIEIPKYLNHIGSSWFYFIFLPIFFYYHFRHCQIDLTTVWPDTAWIFLKILLKIANS